MALSLVVGPAHSGKVAHLLDRFVGSLDDDPWLVVPTRRDVAAVEHDLLRRSPALLSGTVGTFDDLFAEIAGRDPDRVEVGPSGRALLVRRTVARARVEGFRGSAGTRGFVESLAATFAELDAALIGGDHVGGDLGLLAAAFREALDRADLCVRDDLRGRAVRRLQEVFDAWDSRPVLAYGFEDLTAAEWSLVEALAARTAVAVSLPYEPGRPVFASLARTAADLSRLAQTIEELPSGSEKHLPSALAHLERTLFDDHRPPSPPIDGTIRFLEGAGTRGTVELIADAILETIRTGVPAEEVAIVVESPERWRAPLQTVLESFGIPVCFDDPERLGQTAFGSALLSLLRFTWRGTDRRELFLFLRTPYSGLPRPTVDYVEGRLRGRAINDAGRVVEEGERIRGTALPLLGEVRSAPSPADAVERAARAMLAFATGLGRPTASAELADDLRAAQAVADVIGDLRLVADRADETVTEEDVLAALERQLVRPGPTDDPGRVVVVELSRARTRRFDTVFVLGLEEGALPRRGRSSPFLDDAARSELGGRLERPDPVERDRYLFYTACTRPRRRLFVVREGANDDGAPIQPSPFWHDVTSRFDPDDVTRWTRRRPLSALTWPLEGAPTERERLRALSRLAADDPTVARDLAEANGWSRRLVRARGAFARKTRLVNPANLDWLAQRTTFSVTELERFADCSSAWLFERLVSPRTIDAQPDAMLRGQVAHTALHRFYQALPKEFGVDLLAPELEERGVALMRRCVDDALQSGVRIDLTDLQAAELRQGLLRDLEGFVRDEASSELQLVPRRLEVAFGSDRAAPELQRGLALGDGLTLSGKIDRVDIDPFSASGIVQDYKSGKGAHSARDIDRELRLQIPLYLLVLRDLVGVEPLGGVYRALAGKRVARGMLRASASDQLPGFARSDYLDDDAFWAQAETARERASTYAKRIRAGDVGHDPKDGCPSWCDLWTMCRVKHA